MAPARTMAAASKGARIMKIHERLIMGLFLRYLAYTLLGSFILFILVDLSTLLGSFIDNQATISMTLRYYLYKGASFLEIILPISALIATLFTVGSMARYCELTAFYAAGLSLLRIIRPLLIAGLLLTVVALVWREYVLPEADMRMWRVWEVEIHKRAETLKPTAKITARGPDGRLYYARRYDPNTETVTGMVVITTAGASVTERVDAQRAQWDGSHWILHQGTRRAFNGDLETREAFETVRATELAITPQGFSRPRIRPEQMNIRQLMDHRDLLRQTGGDPTGASVDIQFKLAFPLVNLIVVFLGALLASGKRKTTIASGFGLTLLITIGYYILMQFGRSFGHNGVLPPLAAGWIGNGVYAVGTWLLYLRARR